MRARLLVGIIGLAACFSLSVQAQQTIKKELDVGFASIDVIRPVIKDALSPQGRFVMLAGKGAILVIDTPEGILAVEQALGAANLAQVDVALQFQFRTGLPPRRTRISMVREVPLPTAYDAPKIIVGPNGPIGFIPPTPTNFQKRDFGVTSDTTTRMNPDGSVTMDINLEHTELEGFINYGSAILPVGNVGTVPVANQVGNPVFFSPFINSGGISLPVISTTRISTSVVIRPQVTAGVVSLDMMPRLVVAGTDAEAEDLVVNLSQFRTTLAVKNNEFGRVHGFTGASEEFNRRFFDAKPDDKDGSVAITVKAEIKPTGTAAKAEVSEGESESGSPN